MSRKSDVFGGFWMVPKVSKGLDLEARFILGILITRANGDNESWPGQKALAEEVGCSVRTVQRHLTKLVDLKLLEVDRVGNNKTNRYRVTRQIVASVGGTDTTPVSHPDTTPVSHPLYIKEQYEKNIPTVAPADAVATADVFIDVDTLMANKSRHVKLIGYYAKLKGIAGWPNSRQCSEFVRRQAKAATMLLKTYQDTRIDEVMKWLAEHADFKWTLETVGKYVDEDLERLSKTSKNAKKMYVGNDPAKIVHGEILCLTHAGVWVKYVGNEKPVWR